MNAAYIGLVVSIIFAVTSVVDCRGGGASCVEVRRTFATKGIGQHKLVPSQPKKTKKLKICSNSLPTCCNRRMEKKYEKAANMDITKLLDRKLSSFKLHFNTFTDNFDAELRNIILQARSNTTQMLHKHFNNTEASDLDAIVDSFYHNIIIGQDDDTLQDVVMRLRMSVKKFFAQFFSFAFQQQSASSLTTDQLNCVAGLSEKAKIYNNIPDDITKILKTSLNQTSVFAASLRSGAELIEVAGRSLALKECQDGLVKMQYCSHCYGLTLLKPCQGLCQNIVRGCLVGVTEMGRYWPNYVTGLGAIVENMTVDGQDIESALATVTNLIEDALQVKFTKSTLRTIKQSCKISTSRHKRASGKPTDEGVTSSRRRSRRRRRNRNTHLLFKIDSTSSPKSHVLPPHLMLNSGPSIPFEVDQKTRKYARERKAVAIRRGKFEIDQILHSEEAKLHLKSKMRRFVEALNKTIDIFLTLPDDLCDPKHEVSFPVAKRGRCWDGRDMVDSYTRPIAAKGLDGQFNNPEMKINGIRPEAVNAVKNLHLSSETLIRQSGKSQLPPVLEAYYLRHKATSSKNTTLQPSIAPCGDDEDECSESGSGSIDEKQKIATNSSNNDKKQEVEDEDNKEASYEKPSSMTPQVSSTSSLENEVSNAMSIIIGSSERKSTNQSAKEIKTENKENSASETFKHSMWWRTTTLQLLFVLTVQRFLL